MVKAPVVAPKKKGTLKAKLAEKEAEKARRIANGELDYDSDDVLDPRAKARLDRERELNADLANAAELLGAASPGGSSYCTPSCLSAYLIMWPIGTSSSALNDILSAQPRTKEDFHKLSTDIFELIIKKHESKPLYSAFIEHLAREIAQPLKDVEVRKVASGLTTLANEKQKEQRDKASGKKKKGAAKPALGGAKTTTRYVRPFEIYHDFGVDNCDVGWTQIYTRRRSMTLETILPTLCSGHLDSRFYSKLHVTSNCSINSF